MKNTYLSKCELNRLASERGLILADIAMIPPVLLNLAALASIKYQEG